MVDDKLRGDDNDRHNKKDVSEAEQNEHEVVQEKTPKDDDAEELNEAQPDEGDDRNQSEDDESGSLKESAPLKTFEPVTMQHQSALKRFKHWCGRHKVLVSLLSIVIVLGVLAIVPFTRYKIVGLVWQQTATVQVLDSQTHKPVTSAMVMIGNTMHDTNNKGIAYIKVHVGTRKLTVSKAQYHEANKTILVPILRPKTTNVVYVQASGRQVPVSVVNTITGKPVENVTVKTASTQVITDQKGQATIVLPADQQTITATVSGSAYNSHSVKITVTDSSVAANTFQITPAGKVYFLSNRSGNIDVVKSDLDGNDRQTVLAGTGKEDNQNTVLLASRDWKYLALLSKRDGGDNAKLFLISTAGDSVTTMDEGDAVFQPIGWSDHRFAYSVTRNSVANNQPKQQALKSYNADGQNIATLDQSDASGSSDASYAKQNFIGFALQDDQLVYVAQWNWTYGTDVSGKNIAIRSVNVDGSNKKDIKTFDVAQYGSYPAVLPGASSVYYQFYKSGSSQPEYYEYEDGAVKTATDVTQDQFNQGYPTYLQSPSGNQTFWADVRDGKNSLFVGDADGQNGQQILSGSEQTAYGWYTNDYVLSAKSGSELYVMGVKGGQQIKITDYYKPATNFRGYGGGYGGL